MPPVILPDVVLMVTKASLGIAIQYFILGKAGLIVSGLFFFFIVYLLLLRVQGLYRNINLSRTDTRLKLTNELFSGMRYFKLQGWDEKFSEKVTAARDTEMHSWVKLQTITRLAQLFLFSTPSVLLFLILYTHTLISHEKLSAAKTLASLSVMQNMISSIRTTANEGHRFVEGYISCNRLHKFFQLPESPLELGDLISTELVAKMWKKITQEYQTSTTLQNEIEALETSSLIKNKCSRISTEITNINGQSTCVKRNPLAPATTLLPGTKSLIHFKSARFAWDDTDNTSGIYIPEMIVTGKGQLIAVVGPSGSGKTTLLVACLQEISAKNGVAYTNRTLGIAYCAQSPWVLSTTFKRNIIAEASFDQHWYETVIAACALDEDRRLLPGGDEAEIGERGVNLSGGQKARLSIARAIYGQQQLVLLDDPLAALDTKVVNHVFHNAIMRLLVDRGKTVVLVTHNLKTASVADHVIVIDNGELVDQGTWKSLQDSTSLRLEALAETFDEETDLTEEQSSKEPFVAEGETPPDVFCTDDDERLRGRINWRGRAGFVDAVPWYLLSTVPLLFISVTALSTSADYFLTKWTSSLSSPGNTTDAYTSMGYDAAKTYYDLYVTLLFSGVLASAVLFLSLAIMGFLASRRLHSQMLQSVIYAPMHFFDTNKLGQILNRFSNDIYLLDHKLSYPVEQLITSGLSIVAAGIMQILATPLTGAIVVPYFLLTVYLINYVSPAVRELMRLTNISISPILSHLTETIDGLVTIRVMKDLRQRILEYSTLLDRSNAIFLTRIYSFRWLTIRLDFLIIVMVYLLSTLGLVGVAFDWTHPGILGLAIVYTVQTSGAIREAAYYGLVGTSQLNSIDRILHYCNIKPEEGRRGKDRPSKIKASSANFRYQSLLTAEKDETVKKLVEVAPEIEFQNVSLRYQEGFPNVVHNVKLTVKPGTRIGICGRTGSGKTTLAYSLFRLVRIAEGCIMFDGVDITTIPLLELRNHISIIPQEPTVFKGSVRYNLDPFQNFNDDVIWTALEICQLKNRVSNLDEEISEKGDNISAGEKQLFCLARAFLRQSRVLVLDEVTSCVDIDTDNAVQKILKQHFNNSTVFTIAHRLTSLLNYDAVAVMTEGRITEHGSPEDLMKLSGGEFRSLMEAATLRKKNST